MRTDIRWTTFSDQSPVSSLHAQQLVPNGENLTDRHYIATQTGPIKTLGSPLLIMGGVRAEF
jgi:hypothetical protein